MHVPLFVVNNCQHLPVLARTFDISLTLQLRAIRNFAVGMRLVVFSTIFIPRVDEKQKRVNIPPHGVGHRYEPPGARRRGCGIILGSLGGGSAGAWDADPDGAVRRLPFFFLFDRKPPGIRGKKSRQQS